MFGREPERVQIETVLEAARAGPVGVLLEGETGLGDLMHGLGNGALTRLPALSARRCGIAADGVACDGSPVEVLAGL